VVEAFEFKFDGHEAVPVRLRTVDDIRENLSSATRP
jgi:hypothetical protein